MESAYGLQRNQEGVATSTVNADATDDGGGVYPSFERSGREFRKAVCC
jgi:hypothetical protein